MRHRLLALLFAVSLLIATGRPAHAQESSTTSTAQRAVLVELFTSQGCDMCPDAEKILGALAAANDRIVPIAFHVDYFNEPWQDVFSDPIYSQRQSIYNELYTKPKNPNYGLYYTPMLMIDGVESVNGRDAAAAAAAIRRALARKPAVALDVKLEIKPDGSTGTALVDVKGLSRRVEKSPLLVCAVLREDGVVTDIRSGENAGKSLAARFPARITKYEFVELGGKSAATSRFSFPISPTWVDKNLRLAVFAQDKRSGEVYQAVDLPWRLTRNAQASKSEPVSVAR